MDFFDASRFLRLLKVNEDVVVKRAPELPLVRRGNDVDIYSIRPQTLLRQFGNEILSDKGLEARVLEIDSDHFQFDIFDGDGFAIKLDIYSNAPRYRRFTVKDHFLYRMIMGGHLERAQKCEFPILGKVEEGLIRYFEYIEYFWSGPEKPQHLEWILSELTNEERAQLFELAHEVVNFREIESSPGLLGSTRKRIPLAGKVANVVKKVMRKLARLLALEGWKRRASGLFGRYTPPHES